ncbi:hypothetical protein CBD41_00265 [bacterium TMED181]|nr:oligopeptide transporter permease [Planctomycetota bacterium]OUW47838.1 MAG: hypothetical protein CBD41_00265 [bacterium TMED181]
MIQLILRRSVASVITVWAVFTLSFLVIRSAPGGPFDAERDPPEAVKAAIEAQYLLDAPLWQQYLNQGWSWLTLNPGPSLRQPDHDVATILAAGIPASFLLGTLALLLGILLGTILGVIAAWQQDRWPDRVITLFASMGISLPLYVIAGLLILLFAFQLPWLPPAGWTQASSAVLPIICLALAPAAQIARLLRSGLIEASQEDYARTARSKGRGVVGTLLFHCLRPASIPVTSTLGPTAAAMLTGSLVIEQIFAIPGIGMHFIQGAMNRDYPLVLGAVLLYTILLQILTLLGDLLMGWLDPRARVGE